MDREKYKGVTIKGSVFLDAKINDNLKITFTKEMLTEYIPTLNRVMENDSYGFRLLLTIMAHKEGFYKGTRSYRTHNPGNISNTDSGMNTPIDTLEKGILAQRNYILKIINGKHNAYPLGKTVKLAPYYSIEIAKNEKVYGMSPYLPGYEFTFTGQLDQFVKIYSTGARGGNGYLSMIISYFKKNGLVINAQSKIQEIISL